MSLKDEAPVRNLVVAALDQDGCRVLQAASANDALEIANAQSVPIDLLLTDASMPGMSGVELANRLVDERPAIRVMIMSGYADELPAVPKAEQPLTLLSKPFTPRQLRQRIRAVLAPGE